MRDKAELLSLLKDSMDLPAERREAFVRDNTAGDREETEWILSLMEQGVPTHDILDQAAAHIGPDLLAEAFSLTPIPELAPGTRVGRYVLERQVGQGGMGSVYLARREDSSIEQNVAIKFLRPGYLDAKALVRFESEERILARLTHAGIARFYDADVTDSGAPYFVMEYVDGVPITEYCDRERLGIGERLRLFARVCDATAYAQQNLVVHRDLKPGNILVTADGRVKLLDFGIASLLDPESNSHTITRDRALTPRYAAPEQLQGGHATTATDVFSLGVVLFELLTHRLPYPDSANHAEIVYAVCNQVPPVPSTLTRKNGRAEAKAARSDSVSRFLWTDLDAIVLKALRKDADARYRSAAELGEDVRRLLDGLPVHARRGSKTYRMRKFVARHWAGVGAVAIFLAVLAVVISAYTVRVNNQRNRAELEAERSALVSEMISEMFNPTTITGDQLRAHLTAMRERFVDRKQLLTPILRSAGNVFLTLDQPDDALGLFLEVDSLARSERRPRARDSVAASLDVARAWAAVSRRDALAAVGRASPTALRQDDSIRVFETWQRAHRLAESAVSNAQRVNAPDLGVEGLLLRAEWAWGEDGGFVEEYYWQWQISRPDSPGHPFQVVDSLTDIALSVPARYLSRSQRCRVHVLHAKLVSWWANQEEMSLNDIESAFGTALNHCTAAHGYTSRAVMRILGDWGGLLRRVSALGARRRANTLLAANVDLGRHFYRPEDSEFGEGLRRLALSERATRDFSASERHIDELIRVVNALPRDSLRFQPLQQALTTGAVLKRIFGRYEEADSLLSVLPQIGLEDRQYGKIPFIGGWIALDRGDLRKAEPLLRTATEIRRGWGNLQESFTFASYGHVLSLVGKCEEAIPVLEEVREMNVGGAVSALAGAALGRCMAAAGDTEGAIEAYRMTAEQSLGTFMPEIEAEMREFFSRGGLALPDTMETLLKQQDSDVLRIRELYWF